jgi:hypothetical protein
LRLPCRYFPDSVGFNAPDGEDAIFETERGRMQAAAMQSLVPKFKAFAAEHPDVSWTFGGFQHDGMYTNYPMVDQCRTEKQCDGCSDPRFRAWYVATVWVWLPTPRALYVVVHTKVLLPPSATTATRARAHHDHG